MESKKMKYIDFKKDFPKRTIDILKNYKGKYEVTLLINCLTALLILPKEKFYYQIPDVDIKNLNGWGIKRVHVRQVSCTSCGYNLKNIVRHMRNAIAHMKIDTASDNNGNVDMIRFRDRNGFKMEIPVDDLRTFVKELAQYVIKAAKVSSRKVSSSSMTK